MGFGLRVEGCGLWGVFSRVWGSGYWFRSLTIRNIGSKRWGLGFSCERSGCRVYTCGPADLWELYVETIISRCGFSATGR